MGCMRECLFVSSVLLSVCRGRHFHPFSFPRFVPRLLSRVHLSSCELESEEGGVALATLRSQCWAGCLDIPQDCHRWWRAATNRSALLQANLIWSFLFCFFVFGKISRFWKKFIVIIFIMLGNESRIRTCWAWVSALPPSLTPVCIRFYEKYFS